VPYAPELFRGEFNSNIADLRNSVKDRMNAQTSCAAQFVAEALPAGDAVRWLHVDMAGPVTSRDRATGYGVALLAELFCRG
jgi:probable aminopeptidase NPEPL1